MGLMNIRRELEKYRVSVKNLPVAHEAVYWTLVGLLAGTVSRLFDGRHVNLGAELYVVLTLLQISFLVVILMRRWAGERKPRLF